MMRSTLVACIAVPTFFILTQRFIEPLIQLGVTVIMKILKVSPECMMPTKEDSEGIDHMVPPGKEKDQWMMDKEEEGHLRIDTGT